MSAQHLLHDTEVLNIVDHLQMRCTQTLVRTSTNQLLYITWEKTYTCQGTLKQEPIHAITYNHLSHLANHKPASSSSEVARWHHHRHVSDGNTAPNTREHIMKDCPALNCTHQQHHTGINFMRALKESPVQAMTFLRNSGLLD